MKNKILILTIVFAISVTLATGTAHASHNEQTSRETRDPRIAVSDSNVYVVWSDSTNPDKPVDIIMHYTVDDKSLTVIVDGTTEKITDYEFTDIGPALLPTNGLIISHYGGSAIKGLRMDYNAPNYSPVTGWSAMLVNAGMVGATSANACDPTKVTTSYWSQTGVVMNSVGRQLFEGWA